MLKGTVAAVLVALAPGCYGHGGAALLGTAIGASIITAAVVSSQPPPPPRVVYVPPPRSGYRWQPGYWVRSHDQWVWVEGHWVQRYRGYDWEPAHWVEDPDGQWRLVPGRWVAVNRRPPEPAPGPDDEPEPPPPPP